MPTPQRRGDGGVEAWCGSMGTSQEKGGEGGRSREGPAARSDREAACDQRSGPPDVTSSLGRRGGVNLQPEVMSHPTESPLRDSPVEDTPDRVIGSKNEHTT